ncbi:hypothetical protein LINPERHAP1_LOCUS9932 [Linum perenne]
MSMMIMARQPLYTTPSRSFAVIGRCGFHAFIGRVIMLLTI